MKIEKIQQAILDLLVALEVPKNDHNFDRTPERVAKVYSELFAPADTEWPVFDEQFTDMIVMRNHVFFAMCPHHLLPVRIVATIGYIPNGRVLGASKLARVCHDVNRYPKTQEALTNDICMRLGELTEGEIGGVAVHLVGKHGCFEVRGIRSQGEFITTRYTGKFKEDVELQRRFREIVK